MALNKITYTDNVTVIPASNLNEIQDAIIDLEENSGNSVPTNVRQAIYTLLNSAAYAETGLTDEIAIVESWASEVTSLSLSASTLTLNGDTPQTLVATTVPTGSAVVWSSSDTSIATVVGGVVTGVSNGTCTITASAGTKSATCAVTVSGFATLESISAVYTQSGTVYDTDSLDSLKSDLVVTATYSDSSTETVPSTDYTLSGTLTEGTSTIYVVYGGKTTTFTVTVSQRVIRVFKGKGVSGTTIIDNANRALSEPFAFENVAPITVQWLDYSAVKLSFKNTTTNVNTIDTSTYVFGTESDIGNTSILNADAWLVTTDEQILLAKVSGKYQYFTYSSTAGYARLLFANTSDMSVPISETIDGIVYIKDVPYHLVEADVSDFE